MIRHLLGAGSSTGFESSGGEEEEMPCDYVINWSNFRLRGAAPFFMPDPFKTYVQEVRRYVGGPQPASA